MSISRTSSNAIAAGFRTADTLLGIAEAFRSLGEFTHERSTYKRVQNILDKIEELLGQSSGVSTEQESDILNQILMRRTRSDEGERSSIMSGIANIGTA